MDEDEPWSPEFGVNKDLIDDFLNDLEKHDKTLRESRERLEKNRSAGEAGEKYESALDSYYNNVADGNVGQ